MYVGSYAGEIRLDEKAYTAQDLVKLLAEHGEMRDRLATIGTRFYDVQRLVDMLNAVRRTLHSAARGLHIVYTIPTKPGTRCYDNCGRCLAEQLLVLIDG